MPDQKKTAKSKANVRDVGGKKKPGPKRKRGHPRLEVDTDLVYMAAKFFATQAAIADKLGISVSSLYQRKDLRDAYCRGRAEARLSLHQRQFKVAMNGHAGMLMFLGKQYLDQKEKVETTGDVVVTFDVGTGAAPPETL